MLYLFTLQWISDLTIWKSVFFVQINLFLNGQHVEIFEEDLTFTSDEVVSFDLPKISSELKGMFIFVNVSFAIFVLVNHVRFCLWNTFCLCVIHFYGCCKTHSFLGRWLVSCSITCIWDYNKYGNKFFLKPLSLEHNWRPYKAGLKLKCDFKVYCNLTFCESWK